MKTWQDLSRKLSLRIQQLLEEKGKTKEELYEYLGLPPDTNLLSGQYDYTLDDIALTELFLETKLIKIGEDDQGQSNQEETL